ncbi:MULTISPECIES: class I SAM-dependent methyltransferase [unclassified Listeria]|uniref:class I SAM-dependent methyltransferase n=1 Tax=unclassified Listeria TaxID=2642072 RepID=UPI000B5979B9|nr:MULTISPECIES: class I SAM-dependent methyltransferase [unclassified Listeria]
MDDNVFELMAEKYDSPDREALATIIATRIRAELKDSKSHTILDYGSGTGLVGLALSDLAKKMVLVDSAEKMVQIIQSKITQKGISNAQAEVFDLTDNAFPEKVDVILVSLVLLHIPDTKLILKRFYETLNDGGKLIIVDFDKNEAVYHPKVHNGFRSDELQVLLQEAGFSSSEITIFHHGEKVFMKQDADLFIAVSMK